MSFIPTHYKRHFGGPWLEWLGGSFDENELTKLRDPDFVKTKTIEGQVVRVHALAIAGVGTEWNSIDGVTRSYNPPPALQVPPASSVPLPGKTRWSPPSDPQAVDKRDVKACTFCGSYSQLAIVTCPTCGSGSFRGLAGRYTHGISVDDIIENKTTSGLTAMEVRMQMDEWRRMWDTNFQLRDEVDFPPLTLKFDITK